MKSITKSIAILIILSISLVGISQNTKISAEPKRAKGQTDVVGMSCTPIKNVRIGIIGLGNRGIDAVYRLPFIEGTEIKALCDIREKCVKESQKVLTKAGKPAADEYYGTADAWKKVCERDDIDLIYVCTQWDLHTPIAVYAMEHGKHVALEVPAALTMDECWQLVNTSEKTRKHCVMLENCCYDFFEMATLNMAQQGVFGELVHAEGAYIHDLRTLNFSPTYYYDQWRLKQNMKQTGDPYPTHGLGPVCQALNINYGDKMDYLVALGSKQFGMTEYAKAKFGENSKEAQQTYTLGDMNTTLIRTHNGKSILIQHDVTNPRPYDRHHILSGTKGYVQKYPQEGIALEPNAHNWLNSVQFDSMMKKYEHPIVKEVGELAKKVGGHGGMDFIMDYRLIYCLQNGLPVDMDVYDAATWSCLVPLSEYSVKNGSTSVKVPDFTRGAWNKRTGFKHAVK